MFDYYRKRIQRFDSDMPLAEARLSLTRPPRSPYFVANQEYGIIIGRLLLVMRPGAGIASNMAGWISGNGNATSISAIQTCAANSQGFGLIAGIFLVGIPFLFIDARIALASLLLTLAGLAFLDLSSEQDVAMTWYVEEAIMARSGDERRAWQRKVEDFGPDVMSSVAVLLESLGSLALDDHYIFQRERDDNLQFHRQTHGFSVLRRCGQAGGMQQAEQVGSGAASGLFSLEQAMAIALAWLTDRNPPTFQRWTDVH